MKIVIYGRSNCRYCEAAKTLLERKGWEYDYINLTLYPKDQLQDFIDKANMRTVPIIKVDEVIIGGYTDLERYIKAVEQREV